MSYFSAGLLLEVTPFMSRIVIGPIVHIKTLISAALKGICAYINMLYIPSVYVHIYVHWIKIALMSFQKVPIQGQSC